MTDSIKFEKDNAECEQTSVTQIPGLSLTPGELSSGAMEEARFERSSFHSGQGPTEILEQLTGSWTGEEGIPATKASTLNLEQPVYGPTIGAGRIAAINGEQATVKVKDSNGEITEIIVAVAALITL